MSHSIMCTCNTTDGTSRQDRTLAVTIPVPDTTSKMCIIGVFDGHGTYGEIAAVVASNMSHLYFEKCDASWLDRTAAQWEEEMIQLFDKIQQHFIMHGTSGGTTAAIAFFFVNADGTKSQLYHANVGDSPIMLIDIDARASRTISVDDGPDNIEAAARLRAFGPGAMVPIYTTRPHPTRIFLPSGEKDPYYSENHSRLWAMKCNPDTVDYDPSMYLKSYAGNISVSRSLGDLHYVPHGMIHTPHFGSTDQGDNEVVVIVSDGITDVHKRVEFPGYFVDSMTACESAEALAKKITTDANAIWADKFGTADDATVAIAYVKK
jgi:serine/threonine protein phosphatase PrpC